MGKGLPYSLSRASANNSVVKFRVPFSVVAEVAGSSGVGFGAAALGYGFPEGNVLLQAALVKLSASSDSSDIGATFEGDFAVGTEAVDSTTFGGNDANVIGSTALGPAVGGVAPEVTANNITPVLLDNTDNDMVLYLNVLIDDADISGDADVLLEGELHLVFVLLGDD